MHHVISAYTMLRKKTVRLEWTVENASVSSYMKTIKSPKFVLPGINKLCWFAYDDVILTVYRESCGEMARAKCTFYAIDSSENKVPLTGRTALGSDRHTVPGKIFYGTIYDIVNTQNNRPTFVYELIYGIDDSDSTESSSNTMILAEYDKLYESQELCDIEFLIGEEKIKAHKITLAAASSYFRAMFKHENLVENQNQIVDFRHDKDITFQNFQGFLYFIYGCKSINELSDIANELLVLADKFDVKQLREACEFYISNSINKENVTEILILSDKHNYTVLKRKAIIFAKNNIDAVKASKEFENLCKCTDLMKDLL